jgi:hypothetical protein
MVLTTGFVWGGFIYLMVKAVGKERTKRRIEEEGRHG